MKNNSPYKLSAKQLFAIHGMSITAFKGLAKKKLAGFMENGVKAMDAIHGAVIPQLPLAYAPAKGSTLNVLDVTSTTLAYKEQKKEPKKPLAARLVDRIKKTLG